MTSHTVSRGFSATFVCRQQSSVRTPAESGATLRPRQKVAGGVRVTCSHDQPVSQVALCSRPIRHAAAQRLSVRVRAGGDKIEPDGPKKVMALDTLIDRLLMAKNKEELAQLISQNIMSFDANFFLRIASRSDTCSDETRTRLESLANSVMLLLDTMVKQTEGKMEGSTQLLEQIVQKAADEDGEFRVPLTKDQVEAMRQEVSDNVAMIDESMVASIYAWMRKCHEEKMDGMVEILQKVLQLYASQALGGSADGAGPGDALLADVLQADAEDWAATLAAGAPGCGEQAFTESLQKRMEKVVLGMPNGSYSQRVLAEYLKEVERVAGEVASWESA